MSSEAEGKRSCFVLSIAKPTLTVDSNRPQLLLSEQRLQCALTAKQLSRRQFSVNPLDSVCEKRRFLFLSFVKQAGNQFVVGRVCACEQAADRMCLCLCVCVCVSERDCMTERKREREKKKSERETHRPT